MTRNEVLFRFASSNPKKILKLFAMVTVFKLKKK